MNQRIKQLDGFRVVAMGLIVLSHFEFLYNNETYCCGEFYRRYLHNPTFGVDYFFILSGFGLALCQKRVTITFANCLQFAINMVKKIYPLYMFTLVVMLPFMVMIQFKDGFGFTALSKLLIKILLCSSLTQSLTGISTLTHSFNSVAWFLSCITVVYIVCPILLKWLQMRAVSLWKTLRIGVSLMCMFGIATYAAQMIELRTVFDDITLGSPFIRVFYVAFGMVAAYIYRYLRGVEKEKTFRYGELWICLLAIVWFLLRNTVVAQFGIACNTLIIVFDMTLCVTFVLLMALSKGPVSQQLSKLSCCSKYVMYMFLLHYPIRLYIDLLIRENHVDFGVYTGLLESLIITALSLICVKLIYDVTVQKTEKRKSKCSLK